MSNFRIDPDLGDYTLESDGRPTRTNSLLQPAYIRLRAHYGQWLYDAELGSRFFELVNVRITPEVEASILDFTRVALQPLIEDGRANDVEVITIEKSRVGRRIQGRITDNLDRLVTPFDLLVPVG